MKIFFNRIIGNIYKPHTLIKKIFQKINYRLSINKYDMKFFENEQNIVFKHFGLSRDEGIINLETLKKKIFSNLNGKMGLNSEHEVIFSSISIKKNTVVKDILEIGTFDGFNSLLLSNLFPNSKVDTIDLPENDEDFINCYDRKKILKNFVDKRNKILSYSKNINFIPVNSLNLLNYKKKYDLIWIDGAHGYPVVCIDIINSLHLIKENGLILCDDVILNLNHGNSSKMYASIASFETLNELKKQKLVNFKLAFKRLNPENNCLKSNRKYIAIVEKI